MDLNRHINRILKAKHGNPHEILGPHVSDDQLIIRAFLPEARDAWVVTRNAEGGKRLKTPMNRIHRDGFFEAVFERGVEPFDYTIRLVTHWDEKREFPDPYAMPPVLSDFDHHLLCEGTHYKNYEKMGSHVRVINGVRGVHFAVWAPNARSVSVVGEFNGWDARRHLMRQPGASGIWEIFIPDLRRERSTNLRFSPVSTTTVSRSPIRLPSCARCARRAPISCIP